MEGTGTATPPPPPLPQRVYSTDDLRVIPAVLSPSLRSFVVRQNLSAPPSPAIDKLSLRRQIRQQHPLRSSLAPHIEGNEGEHSATPPPAGSRAVFYSSAYSPF